MKSARRRAEEVVAQVRRGSGHHRAVAAQNSRDDGVRNQPEPQKADSTYDHVRTE